jgi:hypothetical protein
MVKEEIARLRTMIHEYGTEDTVMAMIIAFMTASDELSDMGLKDRAIETANMASNLIEMMREYERTRTDIA